MHDLTHLSTAAPGLTTAAVTDGTADAFVSVLCLAIILTVALYGAYLEWLHVRRHGDHAEGEDAED